MRWPIYRNFIVAFGLMNGCSGTPKARTSTPTVTPAPEEATKISPRAQALSKAVESRIVPPVQIRGEEEFSSLQDLMQQLKIPAVSIAVFEKDKLVWAKAYGIADQESKDLANNETRFQAASISKPVNALVLLKVAQEKGLNIKAPVNGYLKSWKVPSHKWSATDPVTLFQLLSHTGGTTVHGFAGYRGGKPVPTTRQILLGQTPSNSAAVVVNQRPGEKFRYSGGGTVISQLLLEDQLGRPYAEIASEYVLTPLQMKLSSYEHPLKGKALSQAAAGHARDGRVIPTKRFIYPELAAAGLWTTPSDLVRFMIAISKARKGEQGPVPPKIARDMTTPAFKLGNQGLSIGLGPFLRELNGHTLFGHGGSNQGFRCEMMASLDDGFGYAIMTNSDNGDKLIQALSRTLFVQLGWPGRNLALERVPLPDEMATSVEGYYSTGGIDVTRIERKNQRIFAQRPFEPIHELVHLGKGKFVNRSNRAFIYLEDGKQALRLEQEGEEPQSVTRVPDAQPSLLWELYQGQESLALAAWQTLSQNAKPARLERYEAQLNRLGYQLAGRQDLAGATKVLHFVTKVRPQSSNAQDSLAEIYALRGERDLAIQHYERSLELLKKDPKVSPSALQSTETRVRGAIEELRKP